MKKTLIGLLTVLGITVVQAQTIKIDGSSTLFPVTEGIAEDFQKATKIKVTVGISGTGGGFKKFCRGETDVQNASRPILEEELKACAAAGVQFLELPVAFDALTVVVSPRNNFVQQLTVEELRRMWEPAAQGRITNWNQINPSFPNAPLKLFGAGADSGTFDYFTEAVVGRAKSSRGDFTASEDDNVLVTGVANDPNGIAYFGYSYYAENTKRLRSVAIVNKDGRAVKPSESSVMDGTYNPLSRPKMIYVNVRALDRPEIQRFLSFYMSNVAKIAREVKYIPLPDRAYENNRKIITDRRTGTVFQGRSKVGITIEELMSLQPK